MRLARFALFLSIGLAGCASYNVMWNAQRHANDARRFEQLGQPAEARGAWAQAATKAAVLSTEKALVLRIEGLAYSGACREMAEPLSRVRAREQDRELRERVDMAEAECAIDAGDGARAQAALAEPLGSRNVDRRSRAEYAAARAAVIRQDYEGAVTHFRRSREPGAAGRALVMEQRARIARATGRADLQPIVVELNRMLHTVSGTEEASRQIQLLGVLTALPETPAARFHAAELARDSLQASALAGRLFLEAAGDTASLFTPKALIAAISLAPERRDSIMAVLDSRYAASPYTRALHGEASVAYVAAEDSLARELGVPGESARLTPVRTRSDVPVPGPRGPQLP